MVHFVGHQLQGRHERATGKPQAVLNGGVSAVPAGDSRVASIARSSKPASLESDEQVARQDLQPFDRVGVRDAR